MTQLDLVKQFIIENAPLINYRIEEWAINLRGEHKMTVESARRHSRTLATMGVIAHPLENGKLNKRKWILKQTPPVGGFKEAENGQLEFVS